MDSIQRYWTRLSKRPSILALVVWLIAMVIIYSIIAIRIDRIKDKIRESGIEITLKSSKLVSLALLENDVQRIHTLLLNATKGSDVIYASVVDHRNKVVAFTGVGHLLPDMTGARRSIENVSIWEGEFKTNIENALNLYIELVNDLKVDITNFIEKDDTSASGIESFLEAIRDLESLFWDVTEQFIDIFVSSSSKKQLFNFCVDLEVWMLDIIIHIFLCSFF